MVLPLVCKPWAHLLGQRSAVWTSACVNLHDFHKTDDNVGRELLDARVVSAWFSRYGTFHFLLTLEKRP